MNAYEHYALGNNLTEYPHDSTYHEVLDMIENGDERISVWEPFENHDTNFIIENIENMKESLECHFSCKSKVIK